MTDDNITAEHCSNEHSIVKAGETDRVVLVIVNKSNDQRSAIRYAGKRARKTGGRIALAYVIDTSEFQHFMGVGDLIRNEAYEEGKYQLQHYAAIVSSITGQSPTLHLREGSKSDEIAKLIDEEPIKVLVLSSSGEYTSSIISAIAGKQTNNLKIPITIVPSNLSDEEIDLLA
ncbi:MAG: universal stress protein [Alphaproteobacteria bacterium]|nr:universal stress protein [Alphaproteobacteria bacterium]